MFDIFAKLTSHEMSTKSTQGDFYSQPDLPNEPSVRGTWLDNQGSFGRRCEQRLIRTRCVWSPVSTRLINTCPSHVVHITESLLKKQGDDFILKPAVSFSH